MPRIAMWRRATLRAMSRGKTLRLVVLACGIALAPIAILAAHAQLAAVAPPNGVFRASVELVQIDVSVTDQHGALVRTLGPGDFSLQQDGHPVPVRFASFVSGREHQTRVVFFVDDYHLSFENFVRLRDAFTRFMSRGALAQVEMLVMPASFFGDKAFTFTTNPAIVLRQLGELTWGEGHTSRPRRGEPMGLCGSLTNDLNDEIFTSGTLGTLTATLTALHQIDGRKAVILMTDGLINGCRDELTALEHLRRLTDVANRGSSVLYGVDARPFGASGSNMIDENLQYLADRTGGFAGRSNAIDAVLERVAADQDGYYLLAYEPPPATFKKGRLQYRDVEVRLTKPDLRVRARAGFYNFPDGRLRTR